MWRNEQCYIAGHGKYVCIGCMRILNEGEKSEELKGTRYFI